MVDFNCAECGYDLRAQTMDDDCPECGLPVRQSRGAGWTPAAGVRRGVSSFAFSVLVGSILAFGYFCLLRTPIGAAVFARSTPTGLTLQFCCSVPLVAPLFVLPLVAGLVWLSWYRLRDRAGFGGRAVVLAAIGGVVIDVTIGAAGAIHVAGVDALAVAAVAAVTAALAAAWVGYSHFIS